MKPLVNLKVLDFTVGSAYPSLMLSDYGAVVIKVEKPGEGDTTRKMGPQINGEGIYQAYLNRGKKSITLDIYTAEGQELVRKLVKEVDAVIENFPTGTMESLGLGYEDMEKINPRIVYGSLTGWGTKGEWKDYPAVDLLVQAKTGFLDFTGFPEKPSVIGYPISEFYAANYLAAGVNAAYNYACETGIGQKVEVNMWESLISAHEDKLLSHFITNERIRRIGNSYPTVNPSDVYRCKDGFFALSVGVDKHWQRFCEEIGWDDLYAVERWKVDPERSENYFGDLEVVLRERFLTVTMDEADMACRRGGVPGGPVNSVEDLFKSEQVKAREMILEVEDERFGKTLQLGKNKKFHDDNEHDNEIEGSPVLGSYNTEVYEGMLHLSQDEIAGLKSKGVI